MKFKNHISSFFISLGLILLLSLLSTLVSNLFNNNVINTLITYSLVIIFISIIYRKKILNDIKNYINDIRSNKKILSFMFILIIIQIVLTSIFKIDSNANANDITNAHNILYAIMLVTLIPICEEFVVRLPYHNCNTFISYIIYTAIFVSLHLLTQTENILLCSIPYTLLSISISTSYIKTNNILVSISTHIINNIICLMILFI